MAPRILVVHCRRDPYDVYVGRAMPRFHLPGSKWGNHRRFSDMAEYEGWLRQQPALMTALPELEGKVLACWCAPPGGLPLTPPLVCHAQVLARLANRVRR